MFKYGIASFAFGTAVFAIGVMGFAALTTRTQNKAPKRASEVTH